MSSYINHYRPPVEGEQRWQIEVDWAEIAHLRQIEQHGGERARKIRAGKDPATNADISTWNSLGLGRARTMMKPWSDADVALLKKLWPNRAYRMVDLEVRLHKADETIRGMALHLGLPTRGEAVAVWPEDKVERLKARWAEGASATEIAKELGGFTRNAIIGKVTRLGLPKRSRLARLAATTTNRRAQAARRPPAPRAPKPKAHYVKFERTPHIGDGPRPSRAGPSRYVDQGPGLATPLTLGAHMCKWPIGDPQDEGFTFCGKRQEHGPYCAEHGRVAFEPASKGVRSQAQAEADEARRYKAFLRNLKAA